MESERRTLSPFLSQPDGCFASLLDRYLVVGGAEQATQVRRRVEAQLMRTHEHDSKSGPQGTPSNRERVDLYLRLSRIAREYEDGTGTSRRSELTSATLDLLGTDIADRVWEGPPDVEGLGELDAVAVAYLCGLLEGSVGERTCGDVNTRLDGCSPEIVTIRQLLPAYSRSWRSVLIIGERGSGKGQFMRAVAAGGPPPLTINLAAVSESLADSELFGHVRGAFTGATETRPGIIQAASDAECALYLDDVPECPESIQVRLLTCLDDGVMRPVGSDEVVAIGRGRKRKFRVFSSSQPGALHKLRPDLRDRLAGLLVLIPPLRDIKMDILFLASVAIQHQSETSSRVRTTKRFSRGACRALLDYAWPGNVRQLFNVVGRALTKAEGSVVINTEVVKTCLRDEEWLAKLSADGNHQPSTDEDAPLPTLEELEARLIQQALERTDGNASQAARLLGVHRTTLSRRLKRRGQVG